MPFPYVRRIVATDRARVREPLEVLRRALGARYEIEREVGSGGAATVYLARDLRHDRPVVFKVLRADSATPAVDEARFAREIKLLARLQHPHILPLHDSGHVEDVLYYVAPYVSGESLRERIQRERQLPVDDALRIAYEAADALDCAHRNGVVHRDIKPENILLSGGHAIVADFGVAQVLDPARNARLTRPGLGGPGTAAYMSPEQLLGDQEVDSRTDLYALGCVLYEMLTGKAAFAGKDGFARRFTEPPRRVRAARRDVPQAVDDAVAKAMARDPDDRYHSAREFARAVVASQAGTVGFLALGVRPQPPAAGVAPQPALGPEVLATSPPGTVGRVRKLGRIAAYVSVPAALLVGAALFGRRPDGRVDAGVPEVKAVAVLPFANLSADPKNEYFADGMTEELISALARVEGLRVTARTSAFVFKGKEVDVRDVARRLGVGSVVEGSVRRAGDRLRVSAKLVDAGSGMSLWSDTYERRAKDVFAVQDEVARAIVGALDVRLTERARGALAHRPTSDPDAYDLYLKGRFAWNQRTPGALAKAREYFAEAITRDSAFALAYVGLADVYGVLPTYSDPPPQYRPLAVAAVRKALSLDSTLAEAHATLGLLSVNEYDWKTAERELLRAIALNPRYATAHHWYGLMLLRQGRLPEAKGPIERARALDPLSPIIGNVHAVTFYLGRDYGGAAERFREVLRFDPDHAESRRWLARALVQKGLYDSALAQLRRAAEIGGTLEDGEIGYVLARAGRRHEAERALAGLRARAERGEYVSPRSVALVHMGLGSKDSAFAWLAKAVERKDRAVPFLKTDPWFDAVRSHPGFPNLLKRMGLEP